ncbi:MAG: ATPase, T2SS/T4P/T4SS family, partial [Myxococcota bacterium]
MPPADKLGELLVRDKIISLQQLSQAVNEQRKTGEGLGQILVRQNVITEKDLRDVLSKAHGAPAVDLKEQSIPPDVIKLIPKELAARHKLIPVSCATGTIILAMVDPKNLNAIDDVKFLTGYNVEVCLASETDVKEAFTKYYGSLPVAAAKPGSGGSGVTAAAAPPPNTEGEYESIVGAFKEEGIEFTSGDESDDGVMAEGASGYDAAPIIKLVNMVLMDAIDKKASDIHVENYEKDFRIRLRIDGELYEAIKPPFKIRNAVVSRLKIMANLDIAERRIPQDGRIKIRLKDGREMDFRVSVLPCTFGEKVVMRLLDKTNLQLDMTKLGFEVEQLNQFRTAIEMPYGMCLVTGPTGSGKTTTLYSALSELNRTTVNIMTAEDPVDYNIEGLNQIQMHEE